jgi:hypothetical protein
VMNNGREAGSWTTSRAGSAVGIVAAEMKGGMG